MIMTREISGSGHYEFDLTDHPAGIYTLRMRNGAKVVSQKFMKE